MTDSRLRIYGLGGDNPQDISVFSAIQLANPNMTFPALLNNDRGKHGSDFFGLKIIGGIELVPKLVDADTRFISLVMGTTTSRLESANELVAAGATLVNLIHPSVDISMTEWGIGNYVQESVVVQAGSRMGNNLGVQFGALIGHEASIGDAAFIGPGATVCGVCHVGSGAFIGANATILPRLSVGKWATVGAGSVVTKDVPDYAVVVGNPAKVIRFNERSYSKRSQIQ